MRSYVRAPAPAWRTAAEPVRLGLRSALSRALLVHLRWQEVARQRRALATLDDHMLKDLGLSRADALRESGRWFWDDGGDPWQIWR
jgi:uncharacterized protein YjiS (DUF1127 family)